MIGLLTLAWLPATISPYDLSKASRYSNLCVDRETGDIDGVRVFIRRNTPRVLVQVAEGGLGELQIAAARYVGGRLTFDLRSDAPTDSISGKMRDGKLSVRTHEPGSRWVTLARTTRNDAPFCR